MLRSIQVIQRRTFTSTSRLLIAEGDTIPSVQLQLKSPGETLNTQELFKDKKAILFGVPGAFTPGCSQRHLPGYIKEVENFKEKGIELIACVAVNDAFVMTEWGKSQQVGDKITLLADSKGELAKAMDLSFDATGALGNHRFKRFAAVLQNGKIQKLFVEPDKTGLNVSLAENVIKTL